MCGLYAVMVRGTACRNTITCIPISVSYHYPDCCIVAQWHKCPDLSSQQAVYQLRMSKACIDLLVHAGFVVYMVVNCAVVVKLPRAKLLRIL